MSRRSISETLPKPVRALPWGLNASWDQVDRRAVEVVRNVVRGSKWPLVIWGSVGSGKTCLSALIYSTWGNNNVRWLTAVEFTRQIQHARRDGQVMLPNSAYTVGEASIWQTNIDGPSLLVVDDLGISDPSQSQQAIIYEMVDRRRGKPFVISTNLSLGEIEQLYDYRVASRLSAGTLLKFDGKDRRPSGESYCISDVKGKP